MKQEPNCFWQLTRNQLMNMDILTVVFILQIHIKALGGDFICNHCSFVETNLPKQPLALISIFCFRNVLCVLSVETAENFFVEMSIKDRAESKHQAEVILSTHKDVALVQRSKGER